MKFEVTRTSSFFNDGVPPCKEARKEPCVRIDSRTFTEKEYNERDLGRGKTWRQEGNNHRSAKKGSGCKISRDFPDEHWVVEINSLEELIKFVGKYGQLVLRESFFTEQPSIEIYDDYRE